MTRARTFCFACAAGGAFALAACASHPAPVESLAGAEAATRTAQEVGAESNPSAQLHLRMANEELASARHYMEQGDNERADFTLLRARADADLALELTREGQAQAAAKTANVKAAYPTAPDGTPQVPVPTPLDAPKGEPR